MTPACLGHGTARPRVALAEAADLAQAGELIAAGLRERWPDYDPRLNPDVESFAQHYRHHVVMVAKEGSEIIGVGVLCCIGPGAARVVRMSVLADRRRRGVGTLVLQALLRRAKEDGVRSVHLETTASWTSAVRFYEQCGFARTELRDGDQHFLLIISGGDARHDGQALSPSPRLPSAP